MEYGRFGILKVGDEIDRSSLPNSVLDTVSFAGGNQFNPATVELNDDTLFAKNLKFEEYGSLLITLGRLVLPASAAIIGADSDHFIETDGGDVLITDLGSAAVLFPVGPSSTEYNPATIINNGVVDDFIVKAMSSRPQCMGSYPLTSVNYQWDIKEVVPGGSIVTLSLGYSDITKSGSQYMPASAEIVHCSGATADKWDGSGESGTAPYTVTGTGFTQFSLFGITSEESILPLTFMQSFTSVIKNQDVALTWKVNCTASKVTMDLEHALGNPENFTILYSIHADAARCNLPFNYVHAMAAGSDNYYRIKITDIDGSISYSKIVYTASKSEGIALSILPNPVHGSSMELHIVSERATHFSISIIDMQGREMKKMNRQAISRGTNLLRIDISNLHKGIYFVRCFEQGKLLQIYRLIKQ